MLTVNGIYEDGKIQLLQKVEKKKRHKVIITFIEPIDHAEEDRPLRPYEVNDSFSFWEDSGEDIREDPFPGNPQQ